MPLNLITAAPPDIEAETTDEYVQKLRENLETAYRNVRESTQAAAERQKKRYDARVKLTEYEPGKFVWVFHPRSKRNRTRKLDSYYVGPCRVERRINAVHYVVRKTPQSKPWVVHVDKLKAFRGEIPKQ